MASSTPEAGRLSATRMSDWSPQSPSSEMLLSAAPLCMPPSSCAGWMEPVLLCLSIGEALCLERTSRSWLEWLQGADGVWEQLATECGVRVECVGPLAKYFKVANWRRVCVECLGEISRELRGEASSGSRGPPTRLDAGDVVELSDGTAGCVLDRATMRVLRCAFHL